jgi:hypothetical protein
MRRGRRRDDRHFTLCAGKQLHLDHYRGLGATGDERGETFGLSTFRATGIEPRDGTVVLDAEKELASLGVRETDDCLDQLGVVDRRTLELDREGLTTGEESSELAGHREDPSAKIFAL